MRKAILKSKNITVYVHEGVTPRMGYNHDRLVVSKQPNSIYTFCADKDDIEYVEV